MTKLALLALVKANPFSTGKDIKKVQRLEIKMPEAIGPKMQTKSYLSNHCSMTVIKVTPMSEMTIVFNFLSQSMGIRIQIILKAELKSQKSKLYIPECQTSDTPERMEQVGIQLLIPISSVEQISINPQINSSVFLLILLSCSALTSSWPIYGKINLKYIGIISKERMARMIQVFNWNTIMKKGEVMAPTPNMNPKNCTFFPEWATSQMAKLRLMITMLSITTLIEAINSVITKLTFFKEKVLANNAKASVEDSNAITALTVNFRSSLLMRNPPRMLAMDLTKNMQEYSVYGSPVSFEKKGIRGPQLATYHPLKKEMKTLQQ